MQPGIYANIPEAEYHASPGVSKSRLTRHARAPRLGQEPQPDTASMRFGTLAHAMILQPQLADSLFFTTDLKTLDPRTAAYKDEAERAQGRQLVKRRDMEAAQRLRDAVMAHPAARELLAPGLLPEQSVFWIDGETDLLCRGRVDGIRLDQRLVVDLKCTRDAGRREFGRSVGRYRYHWQDAFYSEGVEAAGGWTPAAFVFIAVEPEWPHLTACYELPQAVRARASEQVHAQLRHFHACLQTDCWPGLSEMIEELDVPAWALSDEAPPAEEMLEAA